MASRQNREMATLAAQQKMREYEARLGRLGVPEAQRFEAINEWQVKSDVRVKNTVIKARYEDLRARREADLDARRSRLASKLMKEDLQCKQELVAMQETPEQRRAKLATRARELAARRESERQERAKELYERAFAENCDVLRTTQSKRILFRTLEERTAQIEQRMAAKILEEEEKRMFHEMNEQERLKAEQRYQDDKRRQREAREATNKVLDEQIRLVNQRKAEGKSARQQEIAELRSLWEQMAAEQEAEEAQERERMKRLAAELLEFNQLKQMEMSERARKERELDLKILQEALAKEAADEAAEQAARTKRMEDVRRYREQIALMMQHEAEDEAETEAMIQEVFAEQQAKRDAELAAREAARQRLMEEVAAIRQQQILERQLQRQQELDSVEQDRLAQAAEDERQAAQDMLRKAEERKRNLLHKLEIQTQMVSKAHIRAAEETEKLRALEIAQQTEAAYMGKVKKTLDGNQPTVWHGHKRVDWYH